MTIVMRTLVMVLVFAAAARGAAPNDILGVWTTEGGDSKVELFPCEEKICGKIVWLKEPRYRDNAIGPKGSIKLDRKNPDPALRDRPVVGLQVMEGLAPAGAGRWEDGACYDPHSGRSYTCKMKQIAPDRLELRGYIGISLLGRTFVLTR